jgi:hypothetical protein
MKRNSTKKSKSATSRSRSAGKTRGMKMGARSSARSTVSASGRKSASKTGSRAKTRASSTRKTVSAKSNPRVTSAKSRTSQAASRKPRVSNRTSGVISKAVDTLKSAVTSLKSRSALKSTSEMPAKRGETRAHSGGISGARSARVKQPMGTNRNVNASTKPSVGKLPISNIQHASVDERLSPQSDKPYTGVDAFKPNAKGADTLMSAPPRKPIRQSRNQVGVRHH